MAPDPGRTWMHFQKRLLTHVQRVFRASNDEYAAMTREERRTRLKGLMQVAEDLRRPPGEALSSPDRYHDWVVSERRRLGIDDAVGQWDGRP